MSKANKNGLKVKQAIILAGGKGTRLSEQTHMIPKPLVRVGNTPIIVHIMNHLISYGVEHIVIAGGYKIDLIREYFMSDEYKYQGSIEITQEGVLNGRTPHIQKGLKKLTIADTGLSTGTALRIKKASEYLDYPGEPFFMTYGDSVSDVNLDDVVERFESSGSLLTLTAAQYQERFGILKVDPQDNNKVTEFAEKSMSVDEFINGGFMVLDQKAVDYIYDTDDDFSHDTMPRLQGNGLISAHIHKGFWAAMDTQRDCDELNALYDKNPELFHRK